MVNLKELIDFWEKKENIKFFYKNDWIQDVQVADSVKLQPLSFLLESVLIKGEIRYIPMFNARYILLFKGTLPSFSLTPRSIADTITINLNQSLASDSYLLSGFVRDAITEEMVIGATLFDEQTKAGTTSNGNGFFSLLLPAGVHSIRVTAVGKLPTTQRINLDGNTKLLVDLYEQATQLEDVIISSEALNRNISSVSMSQIKLDINTMKTIPPFMGEIDVVKSLLLLPGVSTVGEGASGFNVRGGNVDQNLILLDDVPLFNSSHLFGFFSTFNADMVKDVTLYKGGIPAMYGGRISSVLDVKMKDGNKNKLSASGGVGIISSRLLFEGPLGKKTTFILGGRYAYPDWILKKVPDINVQKSSSYFYDLNFRLRHQFNDKNSLQLSAYSSEDEFKFAADTTYGWGTTNYSAKWNTLISEKLVASVTGLYSSFENSVKGLQPTNEFDVDFGIETKGGKADFTYFLNPNHKIDFGANITYYTFQPGTLTARNNSAINDVALAEEYSVEKGVYVSDEFKISDAVSVQAGLRYSHYSVLGPGDVYIYDPNVPRSNTTIVDTIQYSRGETIKKYDGWEPRVSAKISISPSSSVKVSYNRNYQYLQLISNTTAVSPLDLWKTSNFYIPPQMGDQWAIGYFKNFKDNLYEFSGETYFKQTQNMVEYKDGANLFLNDLIETELLNAKGVAYGVELMTRKNRGNLTGWVSYTYSRSLRQAKGDTPEETVNQGKWYPSNFDKPHDFTLVGNYKFSRRLSLSTNFTYSTGRPITYPQSVYVIDGYSVAQFSDRNQGRIPDYHRLDISFTIEESLRRTKKWKGSWTFSVYNLYGRKNPYSVFFKPQYRGNQTQSYQLSVMGTVFPSITYNFKF